MSTGTDASGAIVKLLTSSSVNESGVMLTEALVGPFGTGIDVNATWTGQGPISRAVFNSHFKADGFSLTSHFNGTDRAATATGSVGGLALSGGELQFADLGFTNSGTIAVCKGTGC